MFKKGAEYNRFGEFYTMNYLPDENAAMDARIFSQEGIILRESQEKCYRRFAQGKRHEIRAGNRFDGIRAPKNARKKPAPSRIAATVRHRPAITTSISQ